MGLSLGGDRRSGGYVECVVSPRDEWRNFIQNSGEDASEMGDNAKAHKSAAKCLPDGVSVISLPAYSPELNPVERFFQELRRKIANRLFSSLEELEIALAEAMEEYFQDTEKVRQLCAYPWILEQVQGMG